MRRIIRSAKEISAPENHSSSINSSIESKSVVHIKRSENLPDKPIIIIEPNHGWVSLRSKDFWNYRDLLFILMQRDIKVRYRQTLLGATWAIIQPLFTMIVFTLFFGKLANISSDGIPYPVFAFAGLLPWTFFSNAITNSGNSLVGSSSLITKVYFPRMIIPIATVLAGLIDFFIGLGFFLILLFYYKIAFSWSLLMFPGLMVLTLLLAIGIGMFMAALNVKYRDIRYALPFFIQLTMFITPIIYPSSIVPEKWRWIIQLNPLTGQIEGYRSAFFNRQFDWVALGMSSLITVGILFCASYIFRRMEKSFADII